MSAGLGNSVEQPPAFRAQARRRELARVLRRRRHLRAGVVQLIAVVIAIGLALAVPQLDIGFEVPTSRAIEMLIAVGAATSTFIGIVFSLLFLVVQFGSTAFTPRLNLFRDAPVVWRTFALYTGVVLYSFTAALVIGGDDQTSGAVPVVAFTGVLASLILYRRLQLSAFRSIQLGSTLAQVVRRGREVIDSLYTEPATETGAEPASGGAGPVASRQVQIRWTGAPGVLQVIDVPRVVRAAERAGTFIHLTVGPGETILEGSVVAEADDVEPGVEHELRGALTVGEERKFEQDPALALRLLADVALRALSPMVNDPATAVQALDAIDGLLRPLASRELDIDHVTAGDGAARVILCMPGWEEYLSVSLDEIIAMPRLSPSVIDRIARLLDGLMEVVPRDRRPALETRRRLLPDPGAS